MKTNVIWWFTGIIQTKGIYKIFIFKNIFFCIFLFGINNMQSVEHIKEHIISKHFYLFFFNLEMLFDFCYFGIFFHIYVTVPDLSYMLSLA